jgi:hypothetical protein
MREKRNANRIFVGKPEGKRPLQQDVGGLIIIRLILETGWGGTGWIDLAQDKDQWRTLVNTVMNFWVP